MESYSAKSYDCLIRNGLPAGRSDDAAASCEIGLPGKIERRSEKK